MVVSEIINLDLKTKESSTPLELIRHYSDSGMMIKQNDTGELYIEAVDEYPSEHTYSETDIPIDSLTEPEPLNTE